MASFFSQKATAKDKSKNKKLDGMLGKKKKASDEQVSLLLLGTGESGKTTIFKQMLLAKGPGFDTDYFNDMKNKLCINVMEGTVNTLLGMSRDDKISVKGDAKFDEMASLILDRKKIYLGDAEDFNDDSLGVKEELELVNQQSYLAQDTFDALKLLWSNEDFRKAQKQLQKNGKYNICDSYEAIMDRLITKYPAWGGLGWAPEAHDVILARVRTTGFHDQKFTYKDVKFRLIDVGGQRAERRKWIHMFNGIAGVLFVAASSEYDQTLYEDGQTNRMVESVNLFKEICENDHFNDSAMILFLNKVDLFDKKFRKEKVPLDISGKFPGAPTKCETVQDTEEGLKFIETTYLNAIPEHRRKSIYVYPTTALDLSKMEAVMDGVGEKMMLKNLARAGIL